jgi:hypothetical protein
LGAGETAGTEEKDVFSYIIQVSKRLCPTLVCPLVSRYPMALLILSNFNVLNVGDLYMSTKWDYLFFKETLSNQIK